VTKVALSREIANTDEIEFRAITAHNQAASRTPGEALDALATQLPAEDADTLEKLIDLEVQAAAHRTTEVMRELAK
jgi:hypothetical protein